MIEPKFKIGQKVRVSQNCDFYADWRGQEMWIAGVEVPAAIFDSWNLYPKKLPANYEMRFEYTTSESWPPLVRGDLTDEWSEEDLEAVGE